MIPPSVSSFSAPSVTLPKVYSPFLPQRISLTVEDLDWWSAVARGVKQPPESFGRRRGRRELENTKTISSKDKAMSNLLQP